MLNIALCDDNTLFLEQLENIINENFKEEVKIVGFSDSQDFLTYLENYGYKSIDIFITDIEMPGIDGIELSKNVKLNNPDTQIIFATNYTSYVEEAFAVEPIYYLVKPFKKEKVLDALEKAKENIEKLEAECVTIQTKTAITRISSSEIKYVESDKRTVIVHTIHEDLDFNMKLDDFQKKLPQNFLRVHKSYLINMKYVSTIVNNHVELLTGEVIPVAKTKFHSAKQKIFGFLGK